MEEQKMQPPPYTDNQAPYPSGEAPNPGFHYQQLAPQPTITMAPTAPAPTTTIVINSSERGGGGNCPACRVGNLKSHFTCCGILWAICCFPIGFICCCCCQDRRCSHCGAKYA